MLVIRLSRVGRKKLPRYRVIVQEHRFAPSGKFVAQVGHFNPLTKETVLDKEQIEKHLASGAQPSNRVAKLLKQEGFKLPDWVVIRERNRPPKTKGEDEGNDAVSASKGEAKSQDKPADKGTKNGEGKEADKDKASAQGKTKDEADKKKDSQSAKPKEAAKQ